MCRYGFVDLQTHTYVCMRARFFWVFVCTCCLIRPFSDRQEVSKCIFAQQNSCMHAYTDTHIAKEPIQTSARTARQYIHAYMCTYTKQNIHMRTYTYAYAHTGRTNTHKPAREEQDIRSLRALWQVSCGWRVTKATEMLCMHYSAVVLQYGMPEGLLESA